MDLLEHIWLTLKMRFNDFIDYAGLSEKWDSFQSWRKIGQNNKLVQAVAFILLSLLITLIYACSQRPDL